MIWGLESGGEFSSATYSMSSPATTPQPAIVIGGTIAIDHVKTPEAEAANLLGGSAAYAALAASFFSRSVSLIGIIGHDFPQEHLEMLEARGISLDGVSARKTSHSHGPGNTTRT